MRYRPEIDGLRALAVGGVIAFHSGLGFLPGGYVGVDVFFVISGFLITSIVARQLDDGTFSLRDFYARRMRRILPALVAIVLALLPVAWFVLLPDDLEGLGKSMLATAGFFSNIHFWRAADYFSNAAEFEPLIHTWSLAIEEQFYLVFPLLFLLLHRHARRMVLWLPILLSLVSLIAAEIVVRRDPQLAFYLTPFRVWEFGLGITTALLLRRYGTPVPSRATDALAAVGLFAIVIAMILFEATTPVPGVWGLLPVGGTALVLAFAAAGRGAGRVLALRPMVAIGLVSYSAYLWHQPVFALARLRLLAEPQPAAYAVLVALTLGLAYLTWRFIEQPFRLGRVVPTRPFAFATTGALAVFIACAVAFDVGEGLPGRLPEEVRQFAVLGPRYDAEVERCRLIDKHNMQGRDVDERPCSLGSLNRDRPDNEARRLLLIGDSHAASLARGLQDRLDPHGRDVLLVTSGGCSILPFTAKETYRERCDRFRERAHRALDANDPAIDTVAFVFRWSASLSTEDFDNGEGGREHRGLGHNPNTEEILARAKSAFAKLVDEERSKGRRVVVLYPMPWHGWNVPKRIAALRLRDGPPVVPLSASRARIEARDLPARRLIDAVPGGRDVLKVDPASVFCDVELAGRCVAERDGLALYRDDDHVNLHGARAVASRIVARMVERGWLQAPAPRSMVERNNRPRGEASASSLGR